mgnify:CR=1 FL=1
MAIVKSIELRYLNTYNKNISRFKVSRPTDKIVVYTWLLLLLSGEFVGLDIRSINGIQAVRII